MKKLVLSVVLVMVSVSSAYAGCVGPIINGECMGAEVYGVQDTDSRQNEHQGSSGSNYQYDLSNGSDRNSYSLDLDAQRRDQMHIGVGRSQDRSMGQYGGGIYD